MYERSPLNFIFLNTLTDRNYVVAGSICWKANFMIPAIIEKMFSFLLLVHFSEAMNHFTHFWPMFSFYTFDNANFHVFSWGMKWEHTPEMLLLQPL